MCVRVHVCIGTKYTCMCYSRHVEVRGQLVAFSSFLPYGFLRWSLAGQFWWQVPLLTEPSHWSHV